MQYTAAKLNELRGHQLLTEEIQAQLPPLNAGEKKGLQAQAVVKFFDPTGQWTWYASEFDGENVFWGVVVGFEVELGYFSLSELETTVGRLDVPIERDEHFRPMTLEKILELARAGKNP